MTLKELLTEKEARIKSVPDSLANSTEKAQLTVINELILMINELGIEKGDIVIDQENLSKINSIGERLQLVIFNSSDYGSALVSFANEFFTQAEMSDRMFMKIVDSFESKAIYKQNLELSTKQAVELLGGAGINQAFINPVKDLLISAVTTGQSVPAAIKSLTAFVVGNDKVDGTLLHHVKQVAYDGFAVADRQYTKLVSEDLGFEFFQYFGSAIEDSRFFCVTRANKYFHKQEIDYWGLHPDLWNAPAGSPYHGGGMIKGTNSSTIWSFAGGYHCRHSIVPVDIAQVPQEDIDRVVELGYYKPKKKG